MCISSISQEESKELANCLFDFLKKWDKDNESRVSEAIFIDDFKSALANEIMQFSINKTIANNTQVD